MLVQRTKFVDIQHLNFSQMESLLKNTENQEVFENNNFETKPTLFGKWSYDDLKVADTTLEIYISIHTTKNRVFVPHTAGRYQLKRFRKAQMPLIERLMGVVAYHGRNTGKKLKAMRIVKQALDIIHHHTGVNPLQIFCDAVCNCGPREDSTRIGSGGVVKRQAVDVSSFRRVNQAIYFLGNAARNKGMRTIRNIAEILADEIMQAAKNSPNCAAIKKKEEIEKNAKANR